MIAIISFGRILGGIGLFIAAIAFIIVWPRRTYSQRNDSVSSPGRLKYEQISDTNVFAGCCPRWRKWNTNLFFVFRFIQSYLRYWCSNGFSNHWVEMFEKRTVAKWEMIESTRCDKYNGSPFLADIQRVFNWWRAMMKSALIYHKISWFSAYNAIQSCGWYHLRNVNIHIGPKVTFKCFEK